MRSGRPRAPRALPVAAAPRPTFPRGLAAECTPAGGQRAPAGRSPASPTHQPAGLPGSQLASGHRAPCPLPALEPRGFPAAAARALLTAHPPCGRLLLIATCGAGSAPGPCPSARQAEDLWRHPQSAATLDREARVTRRRVSGSDADVRGSPRAARAGDSTALGLGMNTPHSGASSLSSELIFIPLFRRVFFAIPYSRSPGHCENYSQGIARSPPGHDSLIESKALPVSTGRGLRKIRQEFKEITIVKVSLCLYEREYINQQHPNLCLLKSRQRW